jgi:hypothetical protein
MVAALLFPSKGLYHTGGRKKPSPLFDQSHLPQLPQRLFLPKVGIDSKGSDEPLESDG